MTTFKDILKSNFLNKVTAVEIPDMLLALFFACIIGLFIFLIYKHTCTSIMYSSSFGLTLIGLSLVTTLVILTITSNVILSLGMVGALSIVRFRAAIKEPLEIVFLFWSIAIGIVLGAEFYPLAIIGSVVIGGILFFFANKKSYEMPYILVLSFTNDTAETKALEYVVQNTKRNQVKTKTVNANHIELTCEIRLKDASTEFLNELLKINGVENATLVSFNGEYMV